MFRSDIQKWLFLCVLCLVPDKKILTRAYDRISIYNPKYMKNTADRWSINVLKDKVSAVGLDKTEPGFDLTDEEIRKFKLWPEGIIPYFIDDFSYDKVLRDRIRNFLDVVGGATGLHFRELPSPPEDNMIRWIFFVNRQGLLGCSDHTPAKMTNEGVQKVVLGYDCMSEEGELAEAVLAIVGVPPQHNSPDRDDYITVETKNIKPDKVELFKKLQDNEWLFHDLEYDFSSAGHFNFHKHTKDGFATISPKKPLDFPVGENDGLSYTDILKVRMLYNYISRKKSNAIKGPECDKLFKPGSNFSKVEPDKKEVIKPRSKPNRYLGLPDDAPGDDINEENDKEEGAEGNYDQGLKNQTDNDENNDNKDDSVTFLKGNPLNLMSDYDTEENNRQLQKHKKRPPSKLKFRN